MSRDTKKSIYILIFGNFLICLGIGLVIPVTPFIKTTYNYTTTQMGLMTSLFALAQFIASPFVGRLSDKIGRKPLIVGGLFFYMISEIIFAYSNSLLLFDVSRIIGGLSAAMFVPTSMAMAADLTTTAQRAKVIGWISAAFSGGLILGPGIGGMLANITYKTPFWAAAVLGLISTIFTLIYLPNVKSESATMDQPKVKIRSILTVPMIILFGMILVASFGLQGFESIYSIYVNQVFGFTLGTIALVLTLNGIISLFLQLVMFDWLVRKMGEIKLIAYCFLFAAISVVWITMAHVQVEVIIATLIIFSAFDLLRPAITTLLTKFGKSNQGLINGLNMSLTSVGNVIGPIMSGMLMDWNTHYPYLVVAIILFASYVITFGVKRVIKPEDLQ
ncbi:tetracycline resistance MFS efflux pump [Companilactobacillus sp. RD055328]|uniref:MFS transporter n=1 Tax=Companilactobacillus sp. RD055328 TaxID=2916634 RepID=UPI001FC8E7D6|nr:MFS transporter [Companilactobacillus sp. RD055328]GKQ42640.1 tetracycline resistance MFS efflux pump [Companilactobacillus sp. RD055328]